MSKCPFIIMIPARYNSAKLPGKPLIDVGGKPLIARMAELALCTGAERVIVVTDNNDIKHAAAMVGAEALAFTGEYPSGTDRIAAACKMLGIDDQQLVVNLPCDIPMLDPVLVGQLVNDFCGSFCEVGTLGEIVPRDRLHTLSDPCLVKLVTDEQDRALLFSRSVIPFDRNQAGIRNPLLNEQYLRHIGAYVYRAATIKHLAEAGVSPLEEMEDIEALRPLSRGLSVNVLTVQKTGCYSINSSAALARYTSGATNVA